MAETARSQGLTGGLTERSSAIFPVTRGTRRLTCGNACKEEQTPHRYGDGANRTIDVVRVAAVSSSGARRTRTADLLVASQGEIWNTLNAVSRLPDVRG